MRWLPALVVAVLWICLAATAGAQVDAAAPWDAALKGAGQDFPDAEVLIGACPDAATGARMPCVSISHEVIYGVDAAIVLGSLTEYHDGFATGAALFFYLFFDKDLGWFFINTMATQNSGIVPLPGREARTSSFGLCVPARSEPDFEREPHTCVPDGTAVTITGGPVSLPGVLLWQLDSYGWVSHGAFAGHSRRQHEERTP